MNRHFFQSPLGWASLASITAMVAFNIAALTWQVDGATAYVAGPAAIHQMELA
ncbi:hypothetical protein ACXYN8_04135 [Altererythrobacter sp. CAU 1778]